MNSPPLSLSSPSKGKGRFFLNFFKALKTQTCALFLTAMVSVQRFAIITRRVAAIMAHQIDLRKAGALLIPIGESANRDLVFEQRARPGARARTQLIFAPLRTQQPIDGGSADLQQLGAGLALTTQLVVPLQHADQLRQGRL